MATSPVAAELSITALRPAYVWPYSGAICRTPLAGGRHVRGQLTTGARLGEVPSHVTSR